jgi:hypothetical protein
MFDPAVPTESGHWVSEGFERLARIVYDYDPQFELRWIPPEHRTSLEDTANPYAIWDTVTNTLIFTASDRDTPEDILTRLFQGDNKHGNVLDRLEARNAAAKALEMKAKMDEAEEKREYAAWLIETQKNYIQLGKGRKVDDQLRKIL